jgi:predicted AAA+ superfamily ATPase
MKMLFAIILLTCSVNAPSQILKRIKDKAVNKAKENTVDRARNEAREAYYKKMNDIRAEFDSSDFDYAVLVSDNSGLFNLKDKENWAASL